MACGCRTDLTDRQIDTLAALHTAGGKIPRAWAMKEMDRASPTIIHGEPKTGE